MSWRPMNPKMPKSSGRPDPADMFKNVKVQKPVPMPDWMKPRDADTTRPKPNKQD